MESAEPEKESVSNPKLDLDTILVEEVGQFGKFQMRTVLLIATISIFNSWSNSYIFTTARIKTRCFIPECDSRSQKPEFVPPWLLNAVPGESNSSFDNCHRYGNITVFNNTNGAICPATSFNPDIIEACESYVYENTNTVVYEFDLGCDEWRRSLIGSMRTLGNLVSLPISGYISDVFGRRAGLIIFAFNAAWIGMTRLFIRSYIVFVFVEFLESAIGVSYTSGYVLLTELVGPKLRTRVAASMETSFVVGQILMAIAAWGTQNWKKLTLALYAPQFVVVVYYWLLPESIRWYMCKGRYEDSEKLLKRVARVNGKRLSEKSLSGLRKGAEIETDSTKQRSSVWLPVLIFQHKKILYRFIVTPVWWITFTLIYYGLSINAVHLSGNPYLNYIAIASVEIPGIWTSVFLINIIGRRAVLITAFWLCASSQLGYIFMPEDYTNLSLALYMTGKYSIATAVSAVYIYTSELYPTQYRQRFLSYCSMVGRIGSILAPFTPALGAAVWTYLPFAIFSGMAFISGLLVFTTPETLGCKLPDTMEEASNIGLERKLDKNSYRYNSLNLINT